MTSNDKGIWLDKDTGKVVKSKPARGRQLVAPGKEMTPKLEALVERYESDNLAPIETATTAPSEERTTKKATTKKSGS